VCVYLCTGVSERERERERGREFERENKNCARVLVSGVLYSRDFVRARVCVYL